MVAVVDRHGVERTHAMGSVVVDEQFLWALAAR
jgi:hypothetical protein